MRRPPKGWSRSTFAKRSHRDNRVTNVPCFTHPDAPGLVVNESGFDWVVSHERSGSFINPHFHTAVVACEFALAIAQVGDFRRSAREVLADESLKGGVVLVRQRPMFASGQPSEGVTQLAADVLDA